jgi:hypothetical protein
VPSQRALTDAASDPLAASKRIVPQLPIVLRMKHFGNTIVGFAVERSGRTPRLMCTTQANREGATVRRRQMFRRTIQRSAAIISDATRIPASMRGDLHDATGHHRYCGSSACNGGERLVETRRGPGLRTVNLCGF